MDLGLVSAFAGGLLMLLSPCSAMLLPAFFAYAFDAPATLLTRTGVFYLGLITTLVPLGVLAGSIGVLVNDHRTLIVSIAAGVVIVMGLVILFGVPVSLGRSRVSGGAARTSSVYLLGAVYGLAGVCAGPLLGAVLAIAALGGNPLYGGVALLLFAAGMTLPLLVLALLWRRVPAVRALVRPRELRIGRWRNAWTNVIGGALTVAVGVLLLATEGTAALGSPIGVTRAFRLESDVMRVTESIPNAAFYIAGVLIVLTWFLLWTRHRRPEP